MLIIPDTNRISSTMVSRLILNLQDPALFEPVRSNGRSIITDTNIGPFVAPALERQFSSTNDTRITLTTIGTTYLYDSEAVDDVNEIDEVPVMRNPRWSLSDTSLKLKDGTNGKHLSTSPFVLLV